MTYKVTGRKKRRKGTKQSLQRVVQKITFLEKLIFKTIPFKKVLKTNIELNLFRENKNSDNVVYNIFSPPITARYIRILPVEWHNHISMRVEIYGCHSFLEFFFFHNFAFIVLIISSIYNPIQAPMIFFS